MRFAVLVYGTEDEKSKVQEIMKKLQEQLNKMPRDESEVVFYIDKGELSIEEKKNWLLGQTTSPFYSIIGPDDVFEDNYMIFRLNAIKNGKPSDYLIDLGVFRKPDPNVN